MNPRNASIYMTKEPETALVSNNINELIEIFDKTKVSHLCVVNSENEMEGIVSKLDLLQVFKYLANNTAGKIYTEKSTNNIVAADIMTKDFISVNVDDDLSYAIEWLLQNKFHCLPVVSGKKLEGVLTSYDLLKAYYEHYG